MYENWKNNVNAATGDMRKIFSKVAIGPKTIDVTVHIKRSEFKDIPAPFLSRFQRYSLSVNDFYRIRLHKLTGNEQLIVRNVEENVLSFIEQFRRQYFYGINKSTLYSCLLSLIKDTTWSSVGNANPYYLISDVYVPRNVTLIIRPGVRILFNNGDFEILVKGFLQVNGNALNPVLL
ncbi:unnamed protein product [Rotaria socialis]|uniref:Uncharacterized protein n=1 Tax=Rotaria socialis TaxID=392032 RepID=A0A820RYM4_9BILA|nr:unnamed protein product [Rotaria socialis]